MTRARMTRSLLFAALVACGPAESSEVATTHRSLVGVCLPPHDGTPVLYPNKTAYVVDASERTPLGFAVDRSGVDVPIHAIDAELARLEDCMERVIERCAVRIKIAPDTVVSESGHDVFPCGDNRCDAMVQDDDVAVTSPSLSQLRFIVGKILNPNRDARITACGLEQ